MKRIISGGLLITSLFGYLEWADKSAFLFEVEFSLIYKVSESAASLVHPLILIPMAGQLLLLFTMIKNPKSYRLIFIGMGAIGVLLGMILLVGILALNFKIILSTVPFLFFSTWTVIRHRLTRKV